LSTFRAADSPAPPLVWLAALVLAGVVAAAFFPLRADDAYIVARYVHQLHAGHGLVYNVGEQVSALTSPGHLFVLAGIGAITDNYVDAYRIGAAMLGAAALLWLGFRTWRGSCRAALFVALVVASPFATFWAVGGLETPLLMTVCAAMAFLATSTVYRKDDGWAWRVVLLGATAVLLRFDASLFAAPIVISVILTHSKAVTAERDRQGRQLVSHRSFHGDGFREAPVTINVELWYRLAEGPIPLPNRIGGACY